MSLPDGLIDEGPCCIVCGHPLWPGRKIVCRNCEYDNADIKAEEQLQDRLEGRRK